MFLVGFLAGVGDRGGLVCLLDSVDMVEGTYVFRHCGSCGDGVDWWRGKVEAVSVDR